MKLPILRSREIIKTLQKAGCIETHRKGSHRFFRSPQGRTTVVPFHKGRDTRKGLLHSILHDLDISPEEFLKLLKK